MWGPAPIVRLFVVGLVLGAGVPGVPGWAQEADSAQGAEIYLSPQDGGPRRWVLTEGAPLLNRAGDPSKIKATLDGGTVVANLGCNPAGDAMWCEVQPLGSRVRGFVAALGLRPAPGPDGDVPMGPDDSRRRASAGDFDAEGQVTCRQAGGEPVGTCVFGVARGDGGDATVVVTFPNGFKRELYFANGGFISGNATMSGNGWDTDWRRDGSRHIVRVDDQLYELPDADIFGN